MKKIILLFLISNLITGCSNSNQGEKMSGMPCHKMGNEYMGDCKKDKDGKIIPPQNSEGSSTIKKSDDKFSQEINDLPEAKPSEIVELKNGDRYEMTAMMVKQEIGNKIIKRLAYNGQIPGPLLKVPKNAEITINLKNDLDVATTLHSHGVRLDSQFDGTPNMNQKPIQPGETFSYKIKFPDEGIYWYHPHIREDYTQELGLYGNYLVEPMEKNYWNDVNREQTLMLDDILINETEPNFDKNISTESLMGRFGNIMLINNEENYSFQAKKGETVRFYLTNVANTRTFNLEIPRVKMKLVGGDNGRVEKEQAVDSIMIAPSERYIFEVKFDEEGSFDILHKTPEKTYKLGQIFVKGEENSVGNFDVDRDNSADFSQIRAQLPKLLKKAPDKSLKLSIDMMGMSNMQMMGGSPSVNSIEWEDNMQMMNGMSNSQNTKWKLIDEQTGKENMDIHWNFNKGDMVKVKIYNDPNSDHPMQHPIHFHGQRFLVLTRNGILNDNFQWKDTALIKTGETVELLVEMTNPGKWMAHCHIAEHLETGMMFQFDVKD